MENARIADRAVGRREDDGRRDERGAAVTGESEDPPRGSESSPRTTGIEDGDGVERGDA